MTSKIDPLIGLHFSDRLQTLGGAPADYLVQLRPHSENVQAILPPGARIVARTGDLACIRAQPAAWSNLQDNPQVESASPLARADEIAVLLQLRDPDWRGDPEGFQRGSRLGNVLSGRASQSAIAALRRDPAISAVEASRSTAAAECIASMPFVGAVAAHGPHWQEQGANALVAIVDGDIDVLHDAFCVPGSLPRRTRIVAVWDQHSSAGATPAQATAANTGNAPRYTQNYGRLHTQSDIDAYLASGNVPPDLQSQPDGHGTHVASIAAGSAFVSAGSSDVNLDGLSFPGGVAPEAGIIVVIPKIRATANDPVSLGYSVSHVDALAFIRQTAQAMNMPVAVNVSLGMNAGAHDGTSLLELAFDEFSGGGRVPGLVVVKSAGNAQLLDGHAQATAVTGGTVAIGWQSSTVLRHQDYLEFWFSSADDLQFGLQYRGTPGSVWQTIAQVDTSHLHDQGAVPGHTATAYLVLERFHRDNGDSQLTVLVRDNTPTALSAAGEWQLRVTGLHVIDGTIDGWIERNDYQPLQFTTALASDGTLSIPGTARTVICVGACDSPQAAGAPTIQSFSSNGPSRDQRRKPELVAPGSDIVAAASGTTRALRRDSGTSMAAPHVTGAVALLLSRRVRQGLPQLNAAQIRAAMSQCLGGYNGSWNRAGGHGWLDIPSLLQTLG